MKTSKKSTGQLSANRSDKKPRDLRRVFTRALLNKARAIGDQYTIMVEPSARGYEASAVEMPSVFVHAATERECFSKLREALMVGVAVMLEGGQTPPAFMAESQRTMQINIRLTAHERFMLESASRNQGFRGVSDFVRNAALAQSRKIA